MRIRHLVFTTILGFNVIGCSNEASVNVPTPDYRVSGTVTFPNGVGIAGVSVSITGNNFQGADQTDADGAYQISNVTSGNHHIRARPSDGFMTEFEADINVGQNDKTFDMKLGVRKVWVSGFNGDRVNQHNNNETRRENRHSTVYMEFPRTTLNITPNWNLVDRMSIPIRLTDHRTNDRCGINCEVKVYFLPSDFPWDTVLFIDPSGPDATFFDPLTPIMTITFRGSGGDPDFIDVILSRDTLEKITNGTGIAFVIKGGNATWAGLDEFAFNAAETGSYFSFIFSIIIEYSFEN